MINVLIADDHHLVRQGIRALLENAGGIFVVGEASNGLEAVQMASELKPDVLIMDINMPRLDGIEASLRIRESGLLTQVLVLSMYSDESLVKRAFHNGVRGYLLKQAVTEELLEAVCSASRREFYLSPALSKIMEIDLFNLNLHTDELDPLSALTMREREICKLVAEGYTNNAIAHELEISIKTVEKHRSSLMEKLSVNDLAGLVREAIKLGLVFVER